MKLRILSYLTAALLMLGAFPAAAALYLAAPAEAVPAGSAPQQGEAQAVEDAAGTLSFGNVEARMRQGNPTLLSVQATLDAQKSFDRKAAYDKLLKGINDMVDGAVAASEAMGTGLSGAAAMTAGVPAMRAQLDAISEKNWAETMEKLDRQLSDTMNQLVVAGEGIYLGILTYENKLGEIERALKLMEQSMEEMELRHRLGQISKLALEEFRASWRATESQAESLRLGIAGMKATLESFLGEPVTGTIALLPLPATPKGEIALYEIDAAQALLLAKEKSFALFQADNARADAEDEWKDAKKAHAPGGYSYRMAEQTHQAALHSYDAAVQGFELSFQSLRRSVEDAAQLRAAAAGDADYGRTSYQAAHKRHELGQISAAALRLAENELRAKEAALEAAEIALFSAYRDYSWALREGIVPSMQ